MDNKKALDRIGQSIEDQKLIEELGLNHDRKHHLSLTVIHLRYFQELCRDEGKSIHEITIHDLIEREREHYESATATTKT